MGNSHLSIGQRIKSIRRLHKLNQTDFAESIGIVSFDTRLYENEETLIFLYRQLQDIAKEEVLDFIELKVKRFKL